MAARLARVEAILEEGGGAGSGRAAKPKASVLKLEDIMSKKTGKDLFKPTPKKAAFVPSVGQPQQEKKRLKSLLKRAAAEANGMAPAPSKARVMPMGEESPRVIEMIEDEEQHSAPPSAAAWRFIVLMHSKM